MRKCYYCGETLEFLKSGQPPICPDTNRDVCKSCYGEGQHAKDQANTSNGTIPSAGTTGRLGRPDSDADW